MKKSLLIIVVVALLFGVWFSLKDRLTKPVANKFQVTASFYPYYFFASEVGGSVANVINITPAGGEPHDYEPTSGDLVQIESSKFLVLNGVVEPWASKIKEDLKGKSTNVLEIDKKLFSQKVIDEEGVNATDPHVWLSPRLAKIQVQEILSEYIKVDPENSNYYSANANKLLGMLDNLDSEFKIGLNNCEQRNIVTSHAAFGYLASDYNLTQTTITGVSPDEEPSLKRLGELADFVRKNNIKYIFFESLVSPKFAETLASETGASTLVLNPIEGLTPEEISQGKSYFTAMQENLKNLKLALDCK